MLSRQYNRTSKTKSTNDQVTNQLPDQVTNQLPKAPETNIAIMCINSDNEHTAFESDVVEVNALNTNQFEPRKYVRYHRTAQNETDKEENELPFNMQEEQEKDPDIVQLKPQLTQGKATNAIEKRHIVHEGILYYITNPDDNPIERLYVPEHLRSAVIHQYHDDNGHVGVQKLFATIKRNYYWPDLFKQLHSYVSTCVICQERNLQAIKPILQETDFSPYPWAKCALDITGPLPLTTSNNKYIVTFIDLLTGWPECFPAPDKSAQTVIHFLLNEIIPRWSCPLQLITDNGAENCNYAMKHVLKELNIDHVTTSFYRPQGNAKCEVMHKSLHAIIAKLSAGSPQSWDLAIPQALGALRFSVNFSTKYSPYFLITNC